MSFIICQLSGESHNSWYHGQMELHGSSMTNTVRVEYECVCFCMCVFLLEINDLKLVFGLCAAVETAFVRITPAA